MSKCIVKKCAATKCAYNKELQCQLTNVIIDKNANCSSFKDSGAKATTTKPSGGSEKEMNQRIKEMYNKDVNWQSQLSNRRSAFTRQD